MLILFCFNIHRRVVIQEVMVLLLDAFTLTFIVYTTEAKRRRMLIILYDAVLLGLFRERIWQ